MKKKKKIYISNSKELLDFNTKSDLSSEEAVGASMHHYGEEPQKTQNQTAPEREAAKFCL